MKTKLPALLGLLLLAIGCAREEILTEMGPDVLYNKAVEAIKEEQYESAKRYMDGLREEHPFSPYAVQAELLNADMLFKQEMYRAAITSYQAFEELHPFHERAPYAAYRRGVATFNLIDTPDRDVTDAAEAVAILGRFVKQNPENPDATDARKKIGSATETLAAHELIVARYYLKTEKPEAARERLKGLLRDYPGTDAAKEGEKIFEKLPEPAPAPAR